MKQLTDEQLCEASDFVLHGLMMEAKREILKAKRKNQWQRHQELGEYLHKIDQIIKEHTLSDQ